ncbi:Glycosyltransferase AglI [uncultured archaeon]|nr:Glycosyltransferase AglI [uncultured archaeon]
MAEKPHFSIIVPTLNEEKYIGACLASIKRQKCFDKCEIIVGDGGSTDNTVKIARDYGAQVTKEHSHTPAAGRHEAAKMASGKLFVFLGADVEICEGWLEAVGHAFEDRKIGWAQTTIRPLEGNALERAGAHMLNFISRVLNAIGLPYVNGDNLIVRADAYWKVGGFNPKMVTSEDTDLGKRLVKDGRFAFVRKAATMLSMRRVRKWGYVRYIVFHTANFFSTHIFSNPAEQYEPVR